MALEQLDRRSRREIVRQAQQYGFTGDFCDRCGGARMVRNGTCLLCTQCGATSGCS